MNEPTNQLATTHPTTLSLIGRIVDSGITGENVAVMKDLVALKREEDARQAKTDFNRALFALKKQISLMDFHADKEGKDKGGNVVYTYCSETEITKKLEPLLFQHGFTMLFGQRQEAERVIVEITLIHENGHEEKREYAVRSGNTNALKDATAADSGATTSAWRHLVIKLFGLKSRITDASDARNIGESITKEQSDALRARCEKLGGAIDIPKFIKYASATKFEDIPANRLAQLEEMLATKEAKLKKTDLHETERSF